MSKEAIVALAAAAVVVGAAVAMKGGATPAPPKPAPQPYWNTLTAQQQAQYEAGLFAWYQQAKQGGSMPWPWPPGANDAADPMLVAVTDLADPYKLGLATAGFQYAMQNQNPYFAYVAQVVDDPTFQGVIAFAPTTAMGARGPAQSVNTPKQVVSVVNGGLVARLSNGRY